jgi:hypothetical protein
MSSTDWGLNLSIIFGAVSIAFSIWFGISEKVRDFLLETKKGQIFIPLMV